MDKTLYLVTGGGGLLGRDVCLELARRGVRYLSPPRRELDITDRDAVSAYFRRYHPDVVIHCAAWTAVDLAEDEAEACERINVAGTQYLSEISSQTGARVLYLSTDYVFPGLGDAFYRTCDEPAPLNVYGWSKLAGERIVRDMLEQSFIVRTSWMYGAGGGFVPTLLRLSETRDELSVVCDQVGSPTYSADLAIFLCDLAASDRFGDYHAAGEGVCSRAELAETLFQMAHRRVRVKPVLTADYPSRARRPLNSRLDTSSLAVRGFNRLPTWQDALERFLRAEKIV